MKKKRMVKAVFVIYCFVLFFILFCRTGINIATNIQNIADRLNDSANLIPFKTIDNYIHAYKHGYIARQVFFANIIGNLILFIPMGMILPAVFKRCKKHLHALAITVLMIVTAEALQIILGVGRLDIDDFILNLLGAVLGRLIYDVISLIKRI